MTFNAAPYGPAPEPFRVDGPALFTIPYEWLKLLTFTTFPSLFRRQRTQVLNSIREDSMKNFALGLTTGEQNRRACILHHLRMG
jgi:hypothetical protein